MHGHIYDISSLSDANGRDSAAPSGDVLTDEDVHRLLHSGNSKETRIFSELRRMIENVDESNKEMLRLREQFTERQRMEEFMEKKLTSVELKAADLRFTVMKENESLPYSRRAGYNDRPARCSNTPAIGLTPSHSDSKNLPPSRQLPPWRPSMPSLPPSPPPGEQVNTDAKPLRSRTRSASLPLTSSQSDQPDNQPPIEVNERRASILPNMSMLVQRIPGWFAGTKYAPPTATVIAGQRRQWSEFYAMGMNWLRPFIIEITPDNDDSVEGTSVLRRSHQGQAWLVRALTSTYGSIALLLVLLLELWLLTSSIHQIGLRAIALDPVHSEEYEQQFYGGGSYHDSLLPT
ncbi:hypothetical protein BDF22DRAFT_226882 [Syncephalis plumigaleata]|nr:hypothetical protein BDF22DRAFT_226882 [Syncephalis plumigaleata]